MKLRELSELRPVQDEAITHIFERDVALIFARPGGGKTVVAWTALEELRAAGVFTRALIAAPLRVAELVWLQEVRQWRHLNHLEPSISIATGTLIERDEAVAEGRPYVVTNHENLLDLLHGNPDASFDALIIDELSKFKGPRSRRWQPLLNMTQHIPLRIGLTGSPAPNGVEDLFGGVRVIDKGKHLGRSWDRWRNANMNLVHDGPVKLWEPRRDTLDNIMTTIAPITFTLADADWRPPPVRRIRVPVELPPHIRSLYNELEEKLIVDTGDDVLIPGGRAQVQQKLLQLSTGFYYTRRDGEEVAQRLDYFRLDAVSAVVEAQRGEPTIIVYDYKEQLRELRRRFPRAPVLGSGTSRRSAQRALDDWNAGRLKELILHPASAGHGLNMQYGGNRMVWCSLPWSLDFYEQVPLRLARSGQAADATLSFETEAVNTLEQRIRSKLGVKGATQDEVFNFGAT